MSKSQSDDTSSADVEIEIISNENGKHQRKKNDDSNMRNVGTLGSPVVFLFLGILLFDNVLLSFLFLLCWFASSRL